ncbi:hypothetical protein B566_EDAN018274 [Ephemera danica]|nr:hypothetical protein B566_EDAN018274 [Ephemera danica]
MQCVPTFSASRAYFAGYGQQTMAYHPQVGEREQLDDFPVFFLRLQERTLGFSRRQREPATARPGEDERGLLSGDKGDLYEVAKGFWRLEEEGRSRFSVPHFHELNPGGYGYPRVFLRATTNPIQTTPNQPKLKDFLMPRKIIVLNDTTTHGGKVISGAPGHTIDGRPIARLGDTVSCPQPGHGVNKIIEGDTSFCIGGRPVALEGHKTECGCALIGSVVASLHD